MSAELSVCELQEPPPLLVVRNTPLLPTTYPLLESTGKWTPLRWFDVPDDCAFQVEPPLVVLRIVPFSPTAQPDSSIDPEFKRSLRSSPAQTMSDMRRRFRSLDRRLARLEKYVTSSRYQLDREFRNLED